MVLRSTALRQTWRLRQKTHISDRRSSNGQAAFCGGVFDAADEQISTREFPGTAPIPVPNIGYDMSSVLYQAQGISSSE